MNLKTHSLSRVASREIKTGRSGHEPIEIIMRADGLDLTEELRRAVARKIGRVRQYAPRAFRARVQFRKMRLKPSSAQFRVAVRYELPGNDVVAEHTAHEALAALDLVAEKIERRLRKRKTATLARRSAPGVTRRGPLADSRSAKPRTSRRT